MEARIELETSCAFFAAKRATPSDLEYIAEAMDRYENAVLEKSDTAVVHNVSFHIAIAAASHNHVLHLIMKILEEVIYEIQTNTSFTQEEKQTVIKSHRLIYEAIASGDAEAAANAMHAHLGPFLKLRQSNLR